MCLQLSDPPVSCLMHALLSALRAAHCLQAAKGLPAEDGSSSGSSTCPDGSSSEERSHCLSPDSAPAVALMNPPRIHGHSLHPATIQDVKLWSRTVPHCPSCSAPLAGWDLDRSCANARKAPSRQLVAQETHQEPWNSEAQSPCSSSVIDGIPPAALGSLHCCESALQR